MSRDLIFPTRLEGLLHESAVIAIVVNASHAGMNIQANQADLEARGNRIHPDVVILYQMSTQITELFLSPRRSELISKGKNAGAVILASPMPNMIVKVFENTSIYALPERESLKSLGGATAAGR
ncbi:MAG: hypothetical protein U0231_15325 [Nitrospiraceae bacterium]